MLGPAFLISPSFLIGLIGTGIGASRSPAMHEREGAAHGLRYLYRLIDLDALGLGAHALPDLLVAAERMGIAGLHVTHPRKHAVVPLSLVNADDAHAVRAVHNLDL